MEETVPKRLPSTSESENEQTQSCSDTWCSDTEAEAETETEVKWKWNQTKTQRNEQIEAKVFVRRNSDLRSLPHIHHHLILSFILFF